MKKPILIVALWTSGTVLADVFSGSFTVDTRYIDSSGVEYSFVSLEDFRRGSSFSSVYVLDTGYPCYPVSLKQIGALSYWTASFECDTGAQFIDSDGDGLPDWWEARYSPDGKVTTLDAFADLDGDGMTNYAEFIALTDPTDPASKFIVNIEMIDGKPRVSWLPDRNEGGVKAVRVYKVWGCENLKSGIWSSTTDDAQRFFKVTVDLP